MEKRRLGKTDIEITPVGLGCWQFAQAGNVIGRVWENLDQRVVTDVVAAALRGGINWFDTAEIYGAGKSERALSAALASLSVRPGSVVVATKWFPFFRTARSIETTIGERISCLGAYPIDLHQIHQPFSFSGVKDQMDAMARLLKAGKIRSVGVSNFSARLMERAHAALAAHGIALASNQMRFNLLDRSIESNGVLDSAKRLGVTIVAYSPLAQGVLTGRFHEDPEARGKVSGFRRLGGGLGVRALDHSRPLVDELRLIARAHGSTVGQVALSWTVTFHDSHIVAIPGASRPAQAEASAAAMGLRLTDKERSRIDELSRAVARR